MIAMKVGAARAAALDWVTSARPCYDGYVGAYFTGSTVGLSADADLPLGSDVDLNLITERPLAGLKLGKFEFQGALLEVTYLPWDQIAPMKTALSSYHIAGGFRIDTIIDDPTGRLRDLQASVSPHFADEVWVRRRCDRVSRKIENDLRAIDSSAPRHDQVMAWVFPTGITTHLLLVAALQNPTVRLRYLKVRQVFERYGRGNWYDELIGLLGARAITRERAEWHVQRLAETFEYAAAASKTPFFWSSDITTVARPISIDASLELIRQHNHRETIFWTVVTFARCHKILAVDAPERGRELAPHFHELLADLGIHSPDDIRKRAELTISFLPRLQHMKEEIMAANPEIVREPRQSL